MQPADSSPTDSDVTSVPPVLNWARLHQYLKQYGVTGIIIILLAYQIGWLGKAQSGACGL